MLESLALEYRGLRVQGIYVLIFITGVFLFILAAFLKDYFAGRQCEIEKDLSDHIAVITGANTGIGKETARKLMSFNCRVIFGARDERKNQKVVEQLSAIGKGKISAYALDLGDRKSIEKFAENVIKQIGTNSINFLINNAGIMAVPSYKKTVDGFEMQMGINYMGHFLLTYLLWSHLKSSKNPRVINVSSVAEESITPEDDIDFTDFNYSKKKYNSWSAYSRSKKAAILFSKELQKRMDEAKVEGISVSLHPGMVRTELSREVLDTGLKKVANIFLTPFTYIFLKSAAEGAQTTLYTVLEDQEKMQKGGYYIDCLPKLPRSKQCRDPEAAKKLWEISGKLYNIKFKL